MRLKKTSQKKPSPPQKKKKSGAISIDSFDLGSLMMPNGIGGDDLDHYYDALEVAFSAYEQPTKAKRVARAKKALSLSPYVVDAHLLLIDEELKDSQEKIKACLDAIELGKKFIGRKAFQEFYGELWMNMDARPTMRAYHQLARLYEESGDVRKAADTLQTMLEMNANDNQGGRYELLPMLIRLKLWDDASRLYTQYKDEYMAMWHYLGALVDFAGGLHTAAKKKIARAHKGNKHFNTYLTGKASLPTRADFPGFYSPGDKSEAIIFIRDVHKAWESVEGALDWLRQTLPDQKAA